MIDSNIRNQSGLQVTGRTFQDTQKINLLIKGDVYYAEFNKEFGCFTFPEEEENYDALEKELSEVFDNLNIDARIEGIF